MADDHSMMEVSEPILEADLPNFLSPTLKPLVKSAVTPSLPLETSAGT
jgi:hypothetical protein